jgi:hypothetical protein
MGKHLPFFFGIFAALALGVGLWTLHFYRILGYRGEGDPINIAAWYDRKEEIAAQIHSPRVILVGGSSVLYGLSAQQLSNEFKVPFLNYGTHAGLPLDYVLYKVRQIAEPGDLLILTLEYEYYPRTKELNSTTIDYYIGGDPSYLNQLDLPQKLECLFSASPESVIQGGPVKSRQYLLRLKRKAEATRDMINEHGDRIGHTRASMSDSQREKLRGLGPVSSITSPDLTRQDYCWSLLSQFAAWCADRQIAVTAAYPNTLDDPSLHEAAAMENFQRIRQRYERIGISVFGDGTEALRPRDDFYDTKYHLNEEGQKARTAGFARVIRPYIETWSDRIAHKRR